MITVCLLLITLITFTASTVYYWSLLAILRNVWRPKVGQTLKTSNWLWTESILHTAEKYQVDHVVSRKEKWAQIFVWSETRRKKIKNRASSVTTVSASLTQRQLHCDEPSSRYCETDNCAACRTLPVSVSLSCSLAPWTADPILGCDTTKQPQQLTARHFMAVFTEPPC